MASNQSVKFVSEGLDEDTFHLTRLNGREAMSSLFEIVIDIEPIEERALSDDEAAKLLASGASVVFDDEHQILGMIRRVEVLPWEEGQRPVYRVTMVPSLWAIAQTRRSRIFQDKDVPTIIREVLAALRLKEEEDFTLKLGRAYHKREYVVQYEESDFAFVSRLAEDEGIFYFFDHREREHIVFSDSNDGCPAPQSFSSIKHLRRSAIHPGEAAVLSLSRDTRVLPEKLKLFDYNWRRPSLALEAEAPVDVAGRGVVHITTDHWSFGDGLKDQKAGDHVAVLRAQELLASRERFILRTNISGIRSGMRLGVDQNLHAMFDRQYLVVSASYELTQPPSWRGNDTMKGFSAELDTIDAAVAFRPARVTPQPHIYGIIYGTIDGPTEGEYAYLDDLGRYKVELSYDVEAALEGRSSCWIRRAQPYAGPGLGMHFPLLAGTEVAIAHLGGDPDRPLILGALSNPETPGPVNNKNATSNVIRTTSGVRMHFEDDV